MTRCYKPIKAHRDEGNNVVFISNPPANMSELMLPCGKCIGCRLNHAEGWAIRMMHEKQNHEENSFITLTYDDDSLPQGGTLNYDDVTKFIKRLRKITGKKLMYYYSGEYGDDTKRPHYHMILFGTEFNENIKYKGKVNQKEHHYTSDKGHKFYTSTLLTDLWSHGHVDFSDVTYDTCMYVAKYVTKKINISHLTPDELKSSYERTDEYGEIVTVEPEKARMSRKPAIGKTWLETFWTDVYNHDYCIIDSKRLRAPKYYDRWLEENNPELFEQIKESRETFQKDLDLTALNRSYEFNLKRHEGYTSSSGEKSKISKFDKLNMQYLKNEIDDCTIIEKRNNRVKSLNNQAVINATHDKKHYRAISRRAARYS